MGDSELMAQYRCVYHFRAEKIKEDYTYVCQDIVKEIKKSDADPYKYFARYTGEHSVTGRVSDICTDTHYSL
jgi:hypothetical protein